MTLNGAGLIFTLVFLGGIYIAVVAKVWRGESGLDGNVPPDWWFLGNPTWRGNSRAYAATVPFLLVMLGGAGIAEWSGREDLGLGLASVTFVSWILVHGSIVLFNRPHALVPPHQRDEPGACEEWRATRRRRAR